LYEVPKVLSSAKNEILGREQQLDLLFRALGDQTRRSLLARLADKPAMVTELAEPFAMSLPAVSRHIRVLESAGLVRRAIDGRVHLCSLSAEPLKNVEVWLRQYRRFWEGTLDSLARYVADDTDGKL
jgi:DNA-binding transcriptional ArsR family regulator